MYTRFALAALTLLAAAPARADVAPEPPQTWGVEVAETEAGETGMRVVLEIHNRGDAPVSLIVDPDTSVRHGTRFIAADATSVQVDGRSVPIRVTQRGPHEVRATEAFSVAAGHRARVAIAYSGEGRLDPEQITSITVHEERQWVGVSVRFGEGAASRSAGPVQAIGVDAEGCACAASGRGRLPAWLAIGAAIGLAAAFARRRR